METIPGHLERLPPGGDRQQAEMLAQGQRERILNAMAVVVAKRGYQGATVEKIVERARMSRGTFYSHFENREACLLAVFDEGLAAARRAVEAALAAPSDDWAAQVRAAIAAFLHFVAENPALARTCLVESITAGAAASARYEAAMRLPVAGLARGRELADPDRVLPDTLEDSVVGGLTWMVHQRLLHNEVSAIEGLLPVMLKFALMPYIGEQRSAKVLSKA